MKSLSNIKTEVVLRPSEIEGFILTEYGIKTDVVLHNDKPIIRTYNHLSLFSIISKIRRNFDFTVLHKFDKNEFVIIIGNYHE